MKCIVFGAGGQLGREWIYQLGSSLEPSKFQFKGFTSREADITDCSAVEEILEDEKPDIVINCAAYTRVDEAEEQRKQATLINATAVRFLADSCANRHIKLVHFSTDYVFPGEKKDRKRLPVGYPEDYPLSPINWYGVTKLQGEQAIRQSGVSYLIIRVSWLCGRYGSNFVKTMLNLAEERDHLDIVDDQWGSPSFAGNVVANTLNLLDKNREGVYHITSLGLTTWYKFAKEIFKISNKEIRINAVSSDAFKTKAERPRYSKLSTQKLAEVEGAELISWKNGLKHLLKQLNI